METTNQIERLKQIWTQIPKSDAAHDILPKDEIVKKFINLLHPGPFFYDIFNTRTAAIEYVSPEIKDVIGYTPEEITLQLFMDRMHPDDRPYYIHHEQSAIEFFSALSPDKLTKYKFSQDVRLKHKNGQYIRLLIQVIPLHYFPEGGARTLSVFTDITFFELSGQPRLSFIGLEGEPSFYNVTPSKEFIPITHSFSRREIEILKYVVEGFSSPQISKKLFIARNTVETHRKNILAKSKCSSTSELIARSIKEGWV